MKSKNKLWIDLVYRFAEQSECKSRQVGAIIVKDNRLVSEGWNSPPPKCSPDDCIRCKDRTKGGPSGMGLDNALCIHAEANAIANAVNQGISLADAEMWCTNKPCDICAGLISRTGIKAVYFLNMYDGLYNEMIFKKAGVELFLVPHTEIGRSNEEKER